MLKVGSRARRIPLNDTARKQFVRAIRRAHYLGSTKPHHFLFPKRVRTGVYDPDQPASASWLRKQWEKLRERSGLEWIRPHDLRHQAITRMLEGGTDEETAKAVAGHISENILSVYSHVRMRAKKAATSILEPRAFRATNLGHRAVASRK
jgi:integrase